ncbi:hypothetical protein NBRC116493_24530 [Aurantivibrio infirmus]
MSKFFKQFFSRLSFRQQLMLTFSLGIVCLAVVSSIVISTITEQRLTKQIFDQGSNVTNTIADQSTYALLVQSIDNARDVADPALSFPDVTGVTILSPDNSVLYHTGAETTPSKGERLPVLGVEHPYQENNDAWYFSLPVYAGGEASDFEDPLFGGTESKRELIGFVQVAVSKSNLQTISRDIFRSNLSVSFIAAAILLLVLLAVTNLVTKPIQELSGIMRRAHAGEENVRADLTGSKDVLEMENAFNTMISELERREDALKRARDTALASARIKGQFATTVSHELRTPMNGVMGMLELLHSMDLNEDQIEYVNIARSSGEELLLLIDDILDFSKIESGKMKLQSSNFDPREMMKGIVELLTSQAQQKHLELNGEVEEQVPAHLFGDSSRIRQILINLVGNALKFTQHGSVIARVAFIEKEDEDSLLHVSVEDTGIGIPENAQQLIFEAFSQADGSTTRQFGGTGLGLAICAQLVQLMGGKIGVKSQLGKGSIFWFTLPITVANAPDLDTKEVSEVAGQRVLIVSRTTDSCHSLIRKFIAWECFQRNTTTASDAITLMKNAATQGKPYDFLIIDTPISDSSETELIKVIKNQSLLSTANIIILTHNPLNDLPPNTKCIAKSPSSKLLEATMIELIGRDKTIVSQDEKTKVKEKTKTKRTLSPAQTASTHVLLVEDNKTNQIVATGMLTRLGFSCDIADNGSAAINALNSKYFDLVLMDCQMPMMNGYTATQLIRGKTSDYQKIPIIALTANTGSADIKRCFTAGMDDYLAKPLTMDTLELKLGKWLSRERPTLATLTSSSDEKEKQASELILDKLSKIDEKVLDDSVIAKLQTQLGDSFESFINTYIEDTPNTIQKLIAALKASNQESFSHCIKLLKSSSNNLGAKKLSKHFSVIEKHATAFTENDIQKIEKIIADELNNTKDELNKIKLSIEKPIENDDVKLLQPHVLIVDDDASTRIVIRGIINKDGYDIHEAENGQQALEYCQKKMPDLILMDALMPELDGFAASKAIIAIESAIKPTILMVTSLQDEDTLDKAFAAGATDFILKPVNATVLRRRVSRVLHSGHIDKHIHQLSYYDKLTSLPNRAFFIERCKNLLRSAKEHNSTIAVLFMDLDRFKMVNDLQGHEIGDSLLKAFSERLESCVRSADIVARLGGDEFTVVLNNVGNMDAVARIAEKIAKAMVSPFTFNDQKVYMTTSIGIALYPKNGETINELMRFADTAMFRAKANGGGCYEFYENGMETEITRQIELEAEIRRALENDEFVLHYQPQVDIHSNELTGLEALIRWHHPVRGMVPPGLFIPVAEKSGLISSIGTWVLNQACQQLRSWLDLGYDPVTIAVNVSGGELTNSVLLEKVAKALDETKIPANLLKLEITEDTLAGCNEQTSQYLQELRNLGVTLAIDDFGTGYSSLNYLKLFPVDTLKIDRSFVKDLPDDANSAAIVSGIIAMGHSLKLQIIAEGIETADQKLFLQKEGCDIMQGFYLSKPLPVDALEAWIIEHQPILNFQGKDKSASDHATLSTESNTASKEVHPIRRLP